MNVLHQTVIPEHAKWVLCKKSKDTKNIKDGRQIIKNAIVKYCGAICIDEVQDIDKHMQEIIEELAAHLFNNNTETNKTKNKLYVALTRSLNELSIYILKEVEDKYTKKRIQDFFERYL